MTLERIKDWQSISLLSSSNRIPVVLLVDQEECPYCRRVESEFLAAIFASRKFENRVIFRKISIDPGETIIDASGKSISTLLFVRPFRTQFTPTILFLNANKEEVAEKLVGLSTPDYYGFYLEQNIDKAILAIK